MKDECPRQIHQQIEGDIFSATDALKQIGLSETEIAILVGVRIEARQLSVAARNAGVSRWVARKAIASADRKLAAAGFKPLWPEAMARRVHLSADQMNNQFTDESKYNSSDSDID